MTAIIIPPFYILSITKKLLLGHRTTTLSFSPFKIITNILF